jgi:hypothetical protein
MTNFSGRNSLINTHTGKPSPTLASNFAKLTVDTILDLDETSTCPPHIALGNYFGWELGEAQRLIEAGFKRKGSTRAWMGEKYALFPFCIKLHLLGAHLATVSVA